MEYKKFEEAEVWQLSKKLAIKIYKITGKLYRKNYALIDQMQRSALSISSNIAEGFDRNSKKALGHFLNISKGSAGELRSQITIAYELQLIDKIDFEQLISECEIISKQLKGFMRFLAKTL